MAGEAGKTPDIDLENISDEDFMKMDPSSFPVPEREADGEVDDEDKDEDKDEDGDQEGEDSGAGEDDDATGDDADSDDKDGESDDASGEGAAEADESSGSEEDEQSESDEAGVEDEGGEAPEDKEEESTDEEKKTLSEDDSKFAEIGRQVMGEFTANGKKMQVKSAEDAIQLMQMGANYHKKMRGLKPSLKTLKLLERNGLLDDEKINFLIDLSQKKPEAITKLLKDSKIDPVDLDIDEETNYTPPKRTVSDKEVDLDEVLDSISGTPSYKRTLNVLGDEWDVTSRKAISENPSVIKVINAHMENGIYDQVAAEVEYQRSLGNLSSVSDFEAYQQVGGYMHENNMFKNAAVDSKQPASSERQDAGQSNKGDTDTQRQERKLRKKAASTSRRKKAPTKKEDDYNPLEMSDEEFIRINKLNI